MIVTPAPGALVRDPATGRAIEDGTTVDETNPYWARLLIDGDLVVDAPIIGEPQAQAVPAKRSLPQSQEEVAN